MKLNDARNLLCLPTRLNSEDQCSHIMYTNNLLHSIGDTCLPKAQKRSVVESYLPYSDQQ